MPRVDDVARELNLSAEEVRSRLSAMGEPVDGGTISDSALERLRAEVDGAQTQALAPEDVTAEGGAPLHTGSLAVDAPPKSEGPERPEGIPSPPPPAATEVENQQPMRKVLKGLAELPILIIVAFLIAVLIKTFLVQAFYIPSGSMEPTLQIGDRVLVEKVSYFVGEPGRGQVVVFARSVFGGGRPDVPWYRDVQNYVRELLGLPTGREEDYIKRIVAAGGDTIRYTGTPRTLFVNGEEVEEEYIKGGQDPGSDSLTRRDCKALKMPTAGRGCRVPAGMVFVMGDNRMNSQDSRVIGPIDVDKIIGRAFLIIWPPSDFSTI